MENKQSPKAKIAPQIPVFNLQAHHAKVEVPTEFDLRDLARRYSVFPLKVVVRDGLKRLLLAMVNPHDARAISDIEFRSGVTVLPVQADKVDIHWLIQTHYFGRKMSPVAQTEGAEVIHDTFQQLEITTGEQARPDWVQDGLQAYQIDETQKS